MARSPIEVVEWNNTRKARASLGELIREVFSDREPGFQVDGVQTINELFTVFDVVKGAMPREFRRQFVFNSCIKGLEPPKEGMLSTVPPHVDQVDGVEGVAIHQNIRGPGKLLLASMNGDTYVRSRTSSVFEPDYSQLKNVREGKLKVGGLTVIAEGGYGSMGQAVHFFDRRGQDELDQWVRYGYSPEHPQESHSYSSKVLHLAQTAFNLLDEASFAA